MKPEQLRAARAILEWSYDTLAQKSGVSRSTIHNFESCRNIPHAETIYKIKNAIELAGIDIIRGGAKKRDDLYQIFEGDDAYLDLLDDVYLSLQNSNAEFLKFGADERKSTAQVIEKLRMIRNSGIKTRSLIMPDNTYILGPFSEYRLLDKSLYSDGDVMIIYGKKVAHLMSWLNTKRVIVINDLNVANHHRKIFDYFWKICKEPICRSVDQVFEEQY